MIKTALITGATSGIGKACAIKFAQNNYNLILTGRRDDRLQQLKKELTKNFKVEITTLTFDVRNREEVKSAIDTLKGQTIDVLINNAGLAAGLDPIQEGSMDDWDQMIDTNVKGLLYITRNVAPLMVEKKSGHIINIGSIAGREVYPKGNVYCASKHAVDALTKGMRIDLLESGIKVTQIAPGAVETEFSMVRFKGNQQTADNVYKGFEPLHPEDIADVAFYVTTLPAHVNINDLLIMPTAQANGTTINRK
ncbi:MAG: NAD(P)-dependent oxidoreductase [Bacteroidetes bacterium HGW-Bacteroidetes-17]|jgi:NADP-dependent 3-hydroxy acid dehydrogenase YdfG|nr:MAG: NAD(P)-dependent oxidoreductase [Bacteroidetes bacterium HGW-Bacteroidetes-17]